MPKVKRESKAPKRPTIEKSQEQILLEKLSEVLWKHGDHTTEHCRRELVKAGIRIEQVTPATLLRVEEMNSERLREGFRVTNGDSKQPVKIVIPGDREFDPSLNPKHPVKGAAAVREEQKEAPSEEKREVTQSKKIKEANTSRQEGMLPTASWRPWRRRPSNKEVVYKAWRKGETSTTVLFALVKEGVKESTIKVWITAWGKGKNLPACAAREA